MSPLAGLGGGRPGPLAAGCRHRPHMDSHTGIKIAALAAGAAGIALASCAACRGSPTGEAPHRHEAGAAAPPKGHVFIFGLGYSGEEVAKALLADGWRVSGTTRSIGSAKRCAHPA